MFCLFHIWADLLHSQKKNVKKLKINKYNQIGLKYYCENVTFVTCLLPRGDILVLSMTQRPPVTNPQIPGTSTAGTGPLLRRGAALL